MIVIDTDVFIDLLRKHKPAVNFFSELEPERVLFSSITEAELLSAQDCKSVSHREIVLHLLALFTKAGVDNPIAQTAGAFRRNYHIKLDDAIIAATAFHTKSTLLTRNLKHFNKVKEIKVETPY